MRLSCRKLGICFLVFLLPALASFGALGQQQYALPTAQFPSIPGNNIVCNPGSGQGTAQGCATLPSVDTSAVTALATGATTSQSSAARFGTVYTPFDFGAKGDTQVQTCTVTTTSGSPTVTLGGTGCTSFSSADVGKYITINYAGAALTTAPVSSVSVTAAGSAYTSIPTFSLSDSTGAGYLGQVNMQLATATVVSGGAGCTTGSQTFTLSGGTSTTAAQVTGTVSSGALSGSLTVATAGSYSGLPSVTAATLTGGGCSTAPTISSTWSVASVSNVFSGYNYTAPTASFGSGAATATVTLSTPVATVLASTISAVNSSTNITLSANASKSLAAVSERVAWGHDDSAAINSAIAAALAGNASVYIPGINQSTNTGYFGAASAINLTSGSLPILIYGAGQYKSWIIALAPMAALATRSTGFAYGGPIQDVGFDGNKLATDVGFLKCSERNVLTRVNFYNAAPYGTDLIAGDGVTSGCNESHYDAVITTNGNGLYTGYFDEPLVGIQINETDSYWHDVVAVNSAQYGFYIASSASNTHLEGTHMWASSGYYPTTTYYVAAPSLLNGINVDGVNQVGVQIASGTVKLYGGSLIQPGSSTLTQGVVVGSSLTGVVVTGFDALNTLSTVANKVVFQTPVGSSSFGFANPGAQDINITAVNTPSIENTSLGQSAGCGSSMTGNSNTCIGNGAGGNTSTLTFNDLVAIGTAACSDVQGSNNTCIGAFSGDEVGSATGDTYVGEGAGLGSGFQTNGNNTAIGVGAFAHVTGAASGDTAIGKGAANVMTTGSNNTLIGTSVGSTTLTTGSSNILIGTSSSVDTYTAGTGSELNIQNVIRGGMASRTSSNLSSCGTSPSISGTASDLGGTITTGSSATACTLTLGQSTGTAPTCIVVARSGTQPTYTTADNGTTATLQLTSAAASSTYDYWCPVH